jgi:transmembrane sensor
MDCHTLSQFPSGDPTSDGAVLDRFFSGESVPAERALVQEWIARTPGAETRIAAFRYVAEAPAIGMSAHGSTQLWSAFRTRLQDGHNNRMARTVRESHIHSAGETPTTRPMHPWLPKSVQYVLGGVVATVLIVASVLGIRSASPVVMPLAVSVYTTGPGERATVLLADSTTVVLNVDSRLEVPIDYASGNRNVRLKGEALFSVSHHHGTPFTVAAGPSVTRVLGTTFAVRHYETDRLARVTVRDGKVAVRDVVLTAQQQAQVGANGQPIVGPAQREQLTFASGVLSLPRTPLSAAIADLNRWYDADIRIGDPQLASRDIRGEFVSGSLAELADILQLAFDIRVVREGRTLTLYAR